jgi:acetyl esterase/lipase
MALHMDPEILAVLGPIGQGPPAGDDVGVLDILRDENIDFARRLMAVGVSTELHVLPGLPHGFEMVAPDAEAPQRVMANRLRRLTNL